jgi:hypothetical protein
MNMPSQVASTAWLGAEQWADLGRPTGGQIRLCSLGARTGHEGALCGRALSLANLRGLGPGPALSAIVAQVAASSKGPCGSATKGGEWAWRR